MNKILITGGAGYVGSALLNNDVFPSEKYQVTIYDNLSRNNYNIFTAPLNNKKNIFVQGDLLDSHKLNMALKDIDTVIHLAATVTTPFSEKNSHSFEQNNHWGTAELCSLIENSSVKRFIYLSSVSVYGEGTQGFTIESNPRPTSHYSTSKLRAEQQLSRLPDKIRTTILRTGSVFGIAPVTRFETVINKFMLEGSLYNKILIEGSGEQKRSFISINSLSKIIKSAVENNLNEHLYNAVEYSASINELSHLIKNIFPKLEIGHVDQNYLFPNSFTEKDPRLDAYLMNKVEVEAYCKTIKETLSFCEL